MVAEDGNGILVYEREGEVNEIGGKHGKKGLALGGRDEVEETGYVEEVGDGADGDRNGVGGRCCGSSAGVVLGAAAEGYGF